MESSSSSSSLQVFDPISVPSADLWNTAQSLWVATIDADIDKIPENEFATVFAGGIVVMLGGVISALIVGAILEKGDLYATLAAESYIQSEDDAEFWKNLSEEEKKKAQILLSKIKEGKEMGIQDESQLKEAVMSAIEEQATNPAVPNPTKEEEATKASNDIFSDYGD
ncbi:hypothetical protein IV203_026773 [Nitzschia inconspicua]|uniref:Uncharacterized protein n=1 Tax=Nitzschia inconspicua TaxID=303405 RepID=A0A9K3LJU5_9STRA|nr:hypothetical protein IV203_026773 [Nitzschia inconspicua]